MRRRSRVPDSAPLIAEMMRWITCFALGLSDLEFGETSLKVSVHATKMPMFFDLQISNFGIRAFSPASRKPG